jgi:hypothetical protein
MIWIPGQNRRSLTPERSPDFIRIQALPRVDWADDHYRVAVAELNRRFAISPTASLWPIQARALLEAHAAGGLFGSISVGGGKTLLSLLLAKMWGARQPLLMVPAKLKTKTYRAMRELARDWKIATNVTVWSYESLSTDNKGGRTKLEQFDPDVVICDEAQALRNMTSARWRKFQRFAQSNYGRVKYAFLSGSIMKTSLLDYWHLITLSLMLKSPLPVIREECAKWSACVDSRTDNLMRPHPGVLLELTTPKKGEDLTTVARRGLKEKMNASRGVVMSLNDDLQTGLVINRLSVTIPDTVKKMIKKLRTDKVTPNGELLDPGDVLTLWRHVRELTCGFYQRWDPPAPLEWLLKRRSWARFEYQVLNAQTPGLDSPYMIRQAYANDPRLLAWEEIKPTFEPNSRPFWVSDHMVQFATEWLKEYQQLVWVEHPHVGKRIAEVAGCRYYGSGDNEIEDAQPGPAVASIAAHGEGKNLQKIWNRALVISAPPSGETWEQLIGRILRHGQEADEVEIDLVLPTRETQNGFLRAIRDEVAVWNTLGGRRRLLRGTYTFDLMKGSET